jgi:very-short-patch-repair endonuclease
MNMIIFASIILLGMIFFVFYRGALQRKQSDSVLRQRAIFNHHEHAMFTRLKAVLPEANILAHVSFDVLLTTKFSHTRRKYENLFADFVIMDQAYRVISIISIGESNSAKKLQAAHYRDAILETAGYRVFRFRDIPEYEHLSAVLNVNLPIQQSDVALQTTQQLAKSDIDVTTDEIKPVSYSYS